MDGFKSLWLTMLERDFRDGPKDRLGLVPRLSAETAQGGAVSLLIDGESAEAGDRVQFELVACEVDLLATGSDD